MLFDLKLQKINDFVSKTCNSLQNPAQTTAGFKDVTVAKSGSSQLLNIEIRRNPEIAHPTLKVCSQAVNAEPRKCRTLANFIIIQSCGGKITN